MKQLFFFLLIALTSCAHHRDGTSVWAGGLWIIPAVALTGAFFLFRAAWISAHSGSIIPNTDPNKPPIQSDDNIPIYKHPLFWFSVFIVIGVVVMAIVVNGEK